MAQNREPPAFQEYAAQLMARTEYRVLSLAAHGLLYSLRLECWVNKSMPSNPTVLARVLGVEKHEVDDALPQIMPFLASKDGQLSCPELDDYPCPALAPRPIHAPRNFREAIERLSCQI